MSEEGRPTAPAEEGKANAATARTPDVSDLKSEACSRHSGSSRLSHRSGSSAAAAAAKARAHAEAARTRALFTQREIAIKLDKIKLETTHQLDQAKLEADLDMLHHEKEAAAALAQAEVLEAAAAAEFEEAFPRKSSHATSLQSRMERTRDYVRAHAHFTERAKIDTERSCKRDPPLQNHPDSANSKQLIPTDPAFQEGISSHPKLIKLDSPNPHPYYSRHGDDPQTSSHPAAHHQPEARDMFDFARFLARRELINTSLMKFDDQPETFRAWKSAFINAIRDLDLTAGEAHTHA